MAEFDEYANEYMQLLHDPIRERFAPGSGFFFERKWQLLRRYMEQTGMQPEKSAWLDVGCGRGDLLRLGAPCFARAAGCDVSAAMMAACADLDVAIQPGPTRLPYPDRSFDLVSAVCVYHHVEIPQRSILTAEIARVLRPGGTACIIEHNPLNPVTRIIVSRTRADAEAKLLGGRISRGLLASAGLGQIRTTYFLYFPEKLYAKLAALEASLAWLPAGGQYATFGKKSA